MLKRLVLSVVVFIIVAIVCYLVGNLLVTVHVQFASSVGSFLQDNSGLIGFLAGVVYFFFGSQTFNPQI